MFINFIQYMSAKFTTVGRRECVLGIVFNCFKIPTEKQLVVRLVISSIFFHGDTLSVVVSPVICELKLYFFDVWESFAFTDFSTVCLLVSLECLSLGLMKFRLLFMCFIIISM